MRKPSKKELIRIAREAGCKTYDDMWQFGESISNASSDGPGDSIYLPGVLVPATLDTTTPDHKAAKKILDGYFKTGKKL